MKPLFVTGFRKWSIRFILLSMVSCSFSRILSGQCQERVDSLRIQLAQVTDNKEKLMLLNQLNFELIFVCENFVGIRESLAEADKLVKIYPSDQELANTDLNRGGYNWYLGNYTTALKYYHKAESIYTTINNLKGLGMVYYGIGILKTEILKYTEAQSYLSKAIAIFEKIGDHYWEGWGLMSISYAYKRESNKKVELEYLSKAEKLYKNFDLRLIEALYKLALGNIDYENQNYKDASKKIEASQKIFEALGNEYRVTFCLYYKGKMNELQGYYQDALSVYLQYIALCEKVDYQFGVAYGYSLLLNVKQSLYEYDTALVLGKKALELFMHTEDSIQIAWSYFRLGEIERRRKQYPSAIKYVSLATDVFENSENPFGVATARALLADIYSTMNELDKALENYESSKNTFTRLGQNDEAAICLQSIAGIYSRTGNHAQALDYLKEIVNIYLETNNIQKLGSTFNQIGREYLTQNNLEEAINYFDKAIEMNEKTNNRESIAMNNWYKSRTYYLLDNYSEALKYANVSLTLSKEIGIGMQISSCYALLGDIYLKQEKITAALQNHMESLKINENISNKQGLSSNYFNIGFIYSLQKNHPYALDYYKRALQINQEAGNTSGVCNAYQSIASQLEDLGEYEEALANYKMSLKLSKNIQNSKREVMANVGIGSILTHQGHYESALEYFTSALEINEKIGDKMSLLICYDRLGLLNKKLENLDKAQEYYEKALQLSTEIGRKDYIRDTHYNLAQIDSIEGDFLNAFIHYQKYITSKDSLNSEINTRIISDLQLSYDVEKKDKEILRLNSEKEVADLELMLGLERITQMQTQDSLKAKEIAINQIKLDQKNAEIVAKTQEVTLLNKEAELNKLTIQKQAQTRNYLLGGIGLLLLLTFFVYNNYLTRQQLKLQKLRNKIAMDLHDDVGSTLSSISIFSEMARQQSKEVVPLLDTIGENSRKMLDAMADIVWTINPENDQFEKIILRMRSFAYQLLGTKNIDFEFDVDEGVSKISLPMEVRKNLYLIFKEATNNMVKYSLADRAYFSIKETNKDLTMIVRDNGKGFDIMHHAEGNGLKNMKKRAEEIGGKLWIESKRDEGTLVRLSIAV